MKKPLVVLASLATLAACSPQHSRNYSVPERIISALSLEDYVGSPTVSSTPPQCKIIDNEKSMLLHPDKECSTTIEEVVEKDMTNEKGEPITVKATVQTTHTYRLEFSTEWDKYMLASPIPISKAVCIPKFKEGTRQVYHACDITQVPGIPAKYPGFLTVNVHLQRARMEEKPLRVYVPFHGNDEDHVDSFVDEVKDKIKDQVEKYTKAKAKQVYYQWGGDRLFGEVVKFFINDDEFSQKSEKECAVEANQEYDKWLAKGGLTQTEDRVNYVRQRDFFLEECYRVNHLGKYSFPDDTSEDGSPNNKGKQDGEENTFKRITENVLNTLGKYDVRAGPNFSSGALHDVVREGDDLRLRLKWDVIKGISGDPHLKIVDLSYRWFGDDDQYALADVSVGGLTQSEKRIEFNATVRDHWISCLADRIGFPLEVLFSRGLQEGRAAYPRCWK